MKVLILGKTGLLGSNIYNKLSCDNKLSIATARFDATEISTKELMSLVSQNDIVINCIGIVKPCIPRLSLPEVFYINSSFPFVLSRVCHDRGVKLITFSSDCVFSGNKGKYVESDSPDAYDLYSLSKQHDPQTCCTIRCSFIGESSNKKYGLIEWIKSQKNKQITGYTNCMWNGVTCIQLAEYIKKLILNDTIWTGVRHVFGSDTVSKYDICKLVCGIYNLNCDVLPAEATEIMGSLISNNRLDRTLHTQYNIDEQQIDIPLSEQLIKMYEYN